MTTEPEKTGKAVLILGNGISRLSYSDFIQSWAQSGGEVWAANYAFREFGPIITRIAGHKEAMVEAVAYRAEHGLSYEIWGGNTGRVLPGSRVFTVPPKWLRDTGSTLVAQALHEGYERIVCCGYDFGGPDVLSPGLWRQDKRNWIERWQEIYRQWGLDRVEFVGHDHKPYIVSTIGNRRKIRDYSSRYLRGLPHIDRPEYIEAHARYMKENGITIDPDRVKRGFMADYVKVKWANGIVSRLSRRVAEIYVDRGKVKIIEELEDATNTVEAAIGHLADSVEASMRAAVGQVADMVESVVDALDGEDSPEVKEERKAKEAPGSRKPKLGRK